MNKGLLHHRAAAIAVDHVYTIFQTTHYAHDAEENNSEICIAMRDKDITW